MKVLNIFDPSSAEAREWRLAPGLETVDQQTADLVFDYLRAGTVLAAPRHLDPDPLRGDSERVVPLSIHTDGQYVWNAAVAYFVRTYRVSPGAEFLAHCHAAGYVPATLSEAERRAALHYVMPR